MADKKMTMKMEMAWMGKVNNIENESTSAKSAGRRDTIGTKRLGSGVCVTKLEIEEYWRRKKMEEEEHLFSAIKAAARIKSQTLTEEEYHKFEESLVSTTDKEAATTTFTTAAATNQWSKEIRLGIKDWWTRSWYAYLNQPALQSADDPRPFTRSSYIPNLSCYTIRSAPIATLGVF